MSYQPLARKYRPQSFKDLVGQELTSQSLANALTLKREAHALIFTGVRGVGKTTVARIYAKALNCENAIMSEPCSVCESCVAIADGLHPDVMEIDGASNTSVEDIRLLKETVHYVPQQSRFKVYMIDEVHMLSGSAFNALLKVLEEPPKHVVFIFATTELKKVPETIQSRCQIFFLRKISLLALEQQLIKVCSLENLKYELQALRMIAREARGSMRDALSLLDHAIALGQGQVTVDVLENLVPTASAQKCADLIHAILSKNAEGIIAIVRDFDQRGADFIDVVEQLAQFTRYGFLLKQSQSLGADLTLLQVSEDEYQILKPLIETAKPLELNRLFRTLVRCKKDLDGSDLDRCIVENYALEWCLDPGLPAVLSGQRAGSMPVPAPILQQRLTMQVVESQPTPSPQLPQPQMTIAEEPTQSQPSAKPSSWRELVERWKQLKPLQARKLEEVYPIEFSDKKIALEVDSNSFASQMLMQKPEQLKLAHAFKELFDFNGELVISLRESARDLSAANVSDAQSILNMRESEELGKKEKRIQEISEHPVTKSLLSNWNATIESIDFNQ